MHRGVTVSITAVAVCLVCLLPVSAAPPASTGVVAAENFYGDLVGQIAGSHVTVTSILSDPNVDPHEYETNAKDAAAVATARLVIQNGLGYDTFMDHLMAASPSPQRKLLLVARITGHTAGDNAHLWYDPPTMSKVAKAITEVLVQIDPANARAYHDGYGRVAASLRRVTRRIAILRARYTGVPIAVTEPVFHYMAAAIGLIVRTPETFQKAIEEGRDPPAAAIAQMEDQLRKHQVKVLLYNTQTISPITARVQQLARQAGLSVVGVSETEPPGKSYQQWMLGQLEALGGALGPGK